MWLEGTEGFVVVVVPAELAPQAATTSAATATAVPIAAILLSFRWYLMADLLGSWLVAAYRSAIVTLFVSRSLQASGRVRNTALRGPRGP